MGFQKIENQRMATNQVSIRLLRHGRHGPRLVMRPGVKAWRSAMIDDGDAVNVHIDDARGLVRIVRASNGAFKARWANGVRISIPDDMRLLAACKGSATLRADINELRDGLIEFALPEKLYED